MTKEQLMEWLKNTGDDEMEVFIRGDNGSIIQDIECLESQPM